MKAIILAVPVLVMSFLTGCTEQSQMTGPVTSQNVVSNRSMDGDAFQKMVVGPGGTKYFISGTLEYSIAVDGKSYELATIMKAEISQSGSDKVWSVGSEQFFKSELDDKGIAVISEAQEFAHVKSAPALRLVLQYRVDDNGVSVSDMSVISVAIAEGI